MKDLLLISGEFITMDVPKDKRYMLKYFHTEDQILFLRYYLTFNCHRLFYPHTGLYRSMKWLKKMKRRFVNLDKAYKAARANFDIEAVEKLEAGKWKLAKNG